MMNHWTRGVLGIGVIVAPFLNLSGETLTWVLVFIGIAITLSSFWALLTEPRTHREYGVESRINQPR